MDTRTQILYKNFESMRLHGFQGLRPDKACAELGVTKGALYHYFPDKFSVGYAIVEEVLEPMYVRDWHFLIREDKPVLECVVEIIERIKGYVTVENVHLGCPLNNLIQEMSPLDEGFKERLTRVVQTQVRLLTEALQYAKANGQLRGEVEPSRAAAFIWSGLEGSYSLSKAFADKKYFDDSIQELVVYVRGLAGA